MAGLSKEQQMEAARTFIAQSVKTREDAKAIVKPLLKQYALADTDGDGTISGKELVESTFKKGGIYSDQEIEHVKKMQCAGNEMLLGVMVAAMNNGAGEALDVFNKPEQFNARMERNLGMVMGHFAKISGTNIKDIAPEVQAYLRAEITKSTRESERYIKATHKQMMDAREIGALPKQLTPATTNDLCDFIASRKS